MIPLEDHFPVILGEAMRGFTGEKTAQRPRCRTHAQGSGPLGFGPRTIPAHRRAAAESRQGDHALP